MSRASEKHLQSRVAERRRAQQRAGDSLTSAANRVRVLRGSGSIRLGAKAAKLRDRVRGRQSRGIDVGFQGVLDQIEAARAALQDPVDRERTLELGKGSEEPPPTEVLRLQRRDARASGDRTKVAVLSWDVGHNPFGRAHLLADLLRDRFDVELWGAQFERYGSDIWMPRPRHQHPDPPISRSRLPRVLRIDGERRPPHRRRRDLRVEAAIPGARASACWRRSCGTGR